MNLPPTQQKVARFVEENKLETAVQTRLLDLVSEVGELCKEALKGSDYGQTSFEPTEEWESELGDAFFSLICMANTTGVNLETALNIVLTKYEKRISRKGEAGSGR